MRIHRGNDWWQFEIRVKRPTLRRAATYIKERSEKTTALVALLAVVVGIATLFEPWLWPMRLTLSFLTLISAITILTRVRVIEAEPLTINITFPETTISRSCPDCGAGLGENPDNCEHCGWQSDNPISGSP